MAAAADALPAWVDQAVPDPEGTLGGAHNAKDQPEHPTMLGHLVKSLMPGQDLTRVTIPSWYLEPRSLLEKMADTMMHPQLVLGYVVLNPAVSKARPACARLRLRVDCRACHSRRRHA